MNDWFKIIVFVLKHMLQKDKPLFTFPKKIYISVSDGVREYFIKWNYKEGAKYE